MIKTEFSYSEEEIKDFFRFHLSTKDWTRFVYYLSSLLFIIAAGLFFFVFEKRLIALLLIIASVILLLLFPVQMNRTLNKQVQSRYKRPKQQIIFYDDKITQKTEHQELVYLWNQILEVNETKKYLYLYIDKASAIIVNKETLSEESKRELILLIKKHKGTIVLYKNK